MDNAVSELFYTITGTPDHGNVLKSGSVLGVGSTFTQTDIDNNAIKYIHDGGETSSDSFALRLSDGSATQNAAFTVSVAAVNDAPVIGTNTGMSLSEDTSKTVTSAMLNEADPDDSGTGCVYTITNCTDHGALKLNGSALGISDTFTQADINNDILTYTHNGGESTSDAFEVELSDGGENGAGVDVAEFAITIVPRQRRADTGC